MVCVRSGVCSPLDEGGSISKPCSRFENDSFAHTSIECISTHQAAGHDQVIMTSRSCVTIAAERAGSNHLAHRSSRSFVGTVAAIVIENDYVKVNTATADRPGVAQAMKVILQSAALNCDNLSLGAQHEAEMLAQEYTGVSTQCAASVSLTHADAKTTALLCRPRGWES